MTKVIESFRESLFFQPFFTYQMTANLASSPFKNLVFLSDNKSDRRTFCCSERFLEVREHVTNFRFSSVVKMEETFKASFLRWSIFSRGIWRIWNQPLHKPTQLLSHYEIFCTKKFMWKILSLIEVSGILIGENALAKNIILPSSLCNLWSPNLLSLKNIFEWEL